MRKITENIESLLNLQEAYIEFLEREVGNVSSIASVHGWGCPKEIYEEGVKFRETIKEIKREL